jgi:hypothetical protein
VFFSPGISRETEEFPRAPLDTMRGIKTDREEKMKGYKSQSREKCIKMAGLGQNMTLGTNK